MSHLGKMKVVFPAFAQIIVNEFLIFHSLWESGIINQILTLIKKILTSSYRVHTRLIFC